MSGMLHPSYVFLTFKLRPPSSKPPSATQYLATNTLRHKPSLSTNNRQHHFPNTQPFILLPQTHRIPPNPRNFSFNLTTPTPQKNYLTKIRWKRLYMTELWKRNVHRQEEKSWQILEESNDDRKKGTDYVNQTI